MGARWRVRVRRGRRGDQVGVALGMTRQVCQESERRPRCLQPCCPTPPTQARRARMCTYENKIENIRLVLKGQHGSS